MNDERLIEEGLSIKLSDVDGSGLDPKTHAVARLGALIALDAAPASYQWDASIAFAAGVTEEEIVGVLIAVAPVVGVAKAVSAAQELALAIGYDIDADLEAMDPWNA
jgi:4-carboxymuconolactone decarboxylase